MSADSKREYESGQPCGCDPGENYRCAQHQAELDAEIDLQGFASPPMPAADPPTNSLPLTIPPVMIPGVTHDIDGNCWDPDPVVIDHDPVTNSATQMRASDYFQPEPARRLLGMDEIRRIGAATVVEEPTDTKLLNDFLFDQRKEYAGRTREDLMEELLRRDRQLALEGRALADGRTGTRLLAEFVRGLITQADHKMLRGALDTSTKAGTVEKLLQAMGAPPADARQLRLHGTTLGAGDTSGLSEDQIAALSDTTKREDIKVPETAKKVGS